MGSLRTDRSWVNLELHEGGIEDCLQHGSDWLKEPLDVVVPVLLQVLATRHERERALATPTLRVVPLQLLEELLLVCHLPHLALVQWCADDLKVFAVLRQVLL